MRYRESRCVYRYTEETLQYVTKVMTITLCDQPGAAPQNLELWSTTRNGSGKCDRARESKVNPNPKLKAC